MYMSEVELLCVCFFFQKLVNDTFQNMWFNPVRDKDQDKLLTRVMNITDVVLACRDTGYEWFEQLLENVSFAANEFYLENSFQQF